jgi:hypothetical protein
MKKYVFLVLTLPAFIACNSSEPTNSDSTAAAIQLPYQASYATDFNNNVSDSDLLVVLNSYKYWETGDMSAFRSTIADSIEVMGASGFKYKGSADSFMKMFGLQRDSLSSVSITMDVWLKNHSVKDSMDFINVWYKEIDTYKNGKVDSAYYEDDNAMKDGKIAWFSSHKQVLK